MRLIWLTIWLTASITNFKHTAKLFRGAKSEVTSSKHQVVKSIFIIGNMPHALKKYILLEVLLLVALITCQESKPDQKKILVAKDARSSTPADTCDDPDAPIACCFEYRPSKVDHVLKLSQEREAGEPLSITGIIFKADGKTPYPDVVLYAYQTDSKGYYDKSGKEKGIQKWHGRLHGWGKTDDNGRYKIQTIRPAPYPDNSMPAHIHMAIRVPATKQSFYISDFVFKDDTLVNDEYLQSVSSLPGGTGIVSISKKQDGLWSGRRDITLDL